MRVIIVEKNAGQRMDKFLKQEIFFNEKITRGEIIRNIRAGKVTVNNKKVKPSYILKKDDKVEINISREAFKLIPNGNIKLDILYKDKNIIVINKPAGMIVHPSLKYENDTLASGLVYRFPEIKTVGDEPSVRPGIVHRLDKDTSGIIVIARNQKTFLELKDKFKNHEVKKTYRAIVLGKLKNFSGIINKPMARTADYKKQTIASAKSKTKIRPAVTEYKIIKTWNNFSLLEVYPKTGRMHQIRVHLASIGHAVAGDKKYKPKNIQTDEKILRQLLHAKKIEFELKEKKFEFEAMPPRDFLDFAAYLDGKSIKS